MPFDDLEAVRQVAEHNKEVVAVMVEPIQGEGGIHVPDDEYLKGLAWTHRNQGKISTYISVILALLYH